MHFLPLHRWRTQRSCMGNECDDNCSDVVVGLVGGCVSWVVVPLAGWIGQLECTGEEDEFQCCGFQAASRLVWWLVARMVGSSVGHSMARSLVRSLALMCPLCRSLAASIATLWLVVPLAYSQARLLVPTLSLGRPFDQTYCAPRVSGGGDSYVCNGGSCTMDTNRFPDRRMRPSHHVPDNQKGAPPAPM